MVFSPIWPQNHMLWVLKGTVMMRWCPQVLKTPDKTNAEKTSIIYAYFSYLASKSHVVGSQTNPIDMIPTSSQNTSKLTHKKTSIIYANFSYLATKSHVVGTQRDDSHKLSKRMSKLTHKKSSFICANFSYFVTEITWCGC